MAAGPDQNQTVTGDHWVTSQNWHMDTCFDDNIDTQYCLGSDNCSDWARTLVSFEEVI